MKYFELEKDERELLRDFEDGKLKPVKNASQAKKRYQEYSHAMLQKTKNINIRLSEHDLLRLKARALEEGIPYQTYMSSLLHKHLKVR
jgi:predicted DNA binding CopG/RHH family protein